MSGIDIAVVPVAGLGTRLLPATKSQPKEMLPVGRKPVVQYVVEELNTAGVEEILFVTGPGKTSIENHFDLNPELIQGLREKGKEELLAELAFERSSSQFFFTRQRELLGLGHAVSCAERFVGDRPFIVALGDSILGLHAESTVVKRMIDLFIEKDASAVIAFEEVPREHVSRYGIAHPMNGGGDERFFELKDVVEKPEIKEAPSCLAIAARYVLSPGIFAALKQITPGKGGELQLTDAIRLLIRNGGNVFGVRLTDDVRRYDVGNFGSYYRAFVDFAMADEKFGADLRAYLKTQLG